MGATIGCLQARFSGSFALAFMVFATPGWALELAVADAEIAPGQTVAMPVRGTDVRGLAALQMDLIFDASAFDIVEVGAGPALKNAFVDFKVNSGLCKVAFAATEAVAQDGELLTIKVRRKPGANDGSIVLPEHVHAWTGAGGREMRVSARPGHIAALPHGFAFAWRYLGAALAALAVAGWVALRARKTVTTQAPKRVTDVPTVPPPRAGATSEPHFCAACGSPVATGAVYCANCGAKIVRP